MQSIEFNPLGLVSQNINLQFEPSQVPEKWQMAAGDSSESRKIACTTVPRQTEKRGHKKIGLLDLDLAFISPDIHAQGAGPLGSRRLNSIVSTPVRKRLIT
jgi:hypothetical protein